MKQKNEERKNLFKEFQTKDKIFNQLFEEKEKIQKYQQDIIATETEIETLKQQEKELENQLLTLQEQLKNQEEKMQQFSSQSLEGASLEIENFLKFYENIEGILADFLEKKQSIKQVEERLEKIKNLYNILNSELVVYSFQNFLPILTEHINVLLSSIVDFSLTMKPDPKPNGDLELKILFNDEKGERDVSSLSG
jgi:DNA repair exonuclease SbcCD ATPase subunit